MATKVQMLTYADYVRIPDDGFRHEIIEGEEFMTPAPGTGHQAVSAVITAILLDFAVQNKAGRVLAAPTDVILSPHDVVQPDVLFVKGDLLSIITPSAVEGAPDLVVEILSPSTASTDRGHKLSLYERSGVKEYWIVDPAAKLVEIHEFARRRTRTHRSGQTFETDVLPGLTINVADLFA